MNANLEASHNILLTVLDSLDAIVYVADLQTYELLFLNKYAREIFGDGIGKPCWQVLQSNQAAPCDFCSNDKLVAPDGTPKGLYAWEFQNTVSRRWHDIRDRAITWINGRMVRLEIATDITARKRAEQEREKLIDQLQEALNEIKTLQGILPVCSYCKKVRDDEGNWNKIEAYIQRRSEAKFSHGICPECASERFPDDDIYPGK